MGTISAERSHLESGDRMSPRRARGVDADPVHIPINRKRVAYLWGGALLALITAIGIIIGMVRANNGVGDDDVVDRGPDLRPGEVQRVPNLPTD